MKLKRWLWIAVIALLCIVLSVPTFPWAWTCINLVTVEEVHPDGMRERYSVFRWDWRPSRLYKMQSIMGGFPPMPRFHGRYTAWHENGQITVEGDYDDQFRVGTWNYWYDNGKLEARAIHETKRNAGMRTVWSPEGILLGQSRWKDGLCMGISTSPPWWNGEVSQEPLLFMGRVIRPSYQSFDLEQFVRAHCEDTGYLALEDAGYDLVKIGRTEWRPDGTVARQTRAFYDGRPIEEREAPPWLWGVEDQTEPTAPGWKEKG